LDNYRHRLRTFRLVAVVAGIQLLSSVSCGDASTSCEPGKTRCQNGQAFTCNAAGTAFETQGCTCTVVGEGLEVSCLASFGGDAGLSSADGGSANGAGGTTGCVQGSRSNPSITDFDNLGGDAGSYFGYTSDNVQFSVDFSDRDGTATAAGLSGPGAGSSPSAGHLAWNDAVAGGAMTLSYDTCYDASSWHGLVWQSMGSAEASLVVRTVGARSYRYVFTPASASAWSEHSASWSEFASDGGVNAGPADVSSIEIAPLGTGKLDLWIDNLGWQ
jgi:hypothetical protein